MKENVHCHNSHTMEKRKVTSFLSVTHAMAINPINHHAFGFNAQGSCLEIRNVGEFCGIVLPKYFERSNILSFFRQLNKFGFKKISKCGLVCALCHALTCLLMLC